MSRGVSPRQTAHLAKAARWLIGEQNRDGSWGHDDKTKRRWTSNAIIALSGIVHGPLDVRSIRKAAIYLRGLRREDEWYLRIPALLAVGEASWLKECGDIAALEKLISADKVGTLAFKVALTTELLRCNIQLASLEAIRSAILATGCEEVDGLYSFGGGHTSHTTLYVLFLCLVGRKEDEELIQRALRWVQIRSIRVRDGIGICWQESHSITAYVMINLMEMRAVPFDTEPIIAKALHYFVPLQDGNIPPDLHHTAHESRSSVYTTILYVRAVGSYLKRYNAYEEAFSGIMQADLLEAPAALHRIFKWLRRLAPWILAGLMLVYIYFFVGKGLVEGALGSLLAALIIALPSIVARSRGKSVLDR